MIANQTEIFKDAKDSFKSVSDLSEIEINNLHTKEELDSILNDLERALDISKRIGIDPNFIENTLKLRNKIVTSINT